MGVCCSPRIIWETCRSYVPGVFEGLIGRMNAPSSLDMVVATCLSARRAEITVFGVAVPVIFATSVTSASK